MGNSLHRTQPAGAAALTVSLSARGLRQGMDRRRQPQNRLLHRTCPRYLHLPCDREQQRRRVERSGRPLSLHAQAALLSDRLVRSAVHPRRRGRRRRRISTARGALAAPGGDAGRAGGAAHAGSRDGQRRTGAGKGPRRARRPGEVAIPGQHEPRNPHAHERGDRHDRAAAGNRSRPVAARSHGDNPRQRHGSAHGHQRHPRLLQDRSRQARSRANRHGSAQRDGRRGTFARHPGAREGARIDHQHRPRGSRACHRRSEPPAPGVAQSRQQRDQIHPGRRSVDRCAARFERCPRHHDPLRAARHRHRHSCRPHRIAVQAVFAARRLHHTALRRHRPRVVDCAPSGGADGRGYRRRERRGRRFAILVHRALQRVGSPGGQPPQSISNCSWTGAC